MSRLTYIMSRLREAGWRGVSAKVGQRVRPIRYKRAYARQSLPAAGSHAAFAEFAADAAQAVASVRGASVPDVSDGFPVLGYGTIELPAGAAWHADGFHGHSWPVDYFPDVDFLENRVRCDTKIPWELSRLQWLIWPFITGDTHGASTRFAGTLADWSAANPPGFGVNWTVGMEVAIRAVNLALAGGAVWEHLPEQARDQLVAQLRAHEIYLHRFPEVSDVPGNHYLADLMGEAVLACALHGLRSKTASEQIARFAAEADSQFEACGLHLEHATVYHRLSLDMVQIVYALALRAGHPGADTLEAVVRRAAGFNARVVSRSGRLPIAGDQDSGFVLWFGEAAQRIDERFCAGRSNYRRVFHDMLAALSGLPERYFVSGIDADASTPVYLPTVRGSGFTASLRTGPQGLKGRAPHDHDDALSVYASVGGVNLLVDTGCHSYTLDPAYREHAIASTAHNVLRPEGAERGALVDGSIFKTARGAATGTITALTDTAVSATLGQPSPFDSQTRTIDVADGLRITDRWTQATAVPLDATYRFAPGWTLSGSGTDWTATCGTLTLQITIEGARARATSDEHSPDYGRMDRCAALILSAPASLSGTLSILFTSQP